MEGIISHFLEHLNLNNDVFKFLSIFLHYNIMLSQKCKLKKSYLSYRHVQTSNEEAIKFYERFDFKIVGTKEDYYKRIEPPDAYILEKELGQTVDIASIQSQ